MPNWIKTIVKTKPNIIQDILKNYSEENALSFNKIIPMPKDLDIEHGSRGEKGLIYLFLLDNNISKNTINEVYKSLNPFHRDIFHSYAFPEIFLKYEQEKNSHKIEMDIARKYVSNYEKHGYPTWMEFRCDKWGTKWDAGSFKNNDDTMTFETAWNFADKAIKELSRKYPEAVFECQYADEGIKENSGILKIKNGEEFDVKTNLSEKKIEEIWDYEIEQKEEVELDEIEI